LVKNVSTQNYNLAPYGGRVVYETNETNRENEIRSEKNMIFPDIETAERFMREQVKLVGNKNKALPQIKTTSTTADSKTIKSWVTSNLRPIFIINGKRYGFFTNEKSTTEGLTLSYGGTRKQADNSLAMTAAREHLEETLEVILGVLG